MKVKLIEKSPFFREEFGQGEPVWFEAGELFDVVETKVMRPDNRKWYKIKSKWFNKPLGGFHNPDGFQKQG
jgi:hypothetical protein